MKNLYVLEWSKKQSFFHIQPLEKHLERNQMAFISGDNLNDYHVIFVGEKEAVHRMADQWRHRLLQAA